MKENSSTDLTFPQFLAKRVINDIVPIARKYKKSLRVVEPEIMYTLTQLYYHKVIDKKLYREVLEDLYSQ